MVDHCQLTGPAQSTALEGDVVKRTLSRICSLVSSSPDEASPGGAPGCRGKWLLLVYAMLGSSLTGCALFYGRMAPVNLQEPGWTVRQGQAVWKLPSGHDIAGDVLVATAQGIEGVLSDPAPESFFTSFGDSCLNMSLFFWVQEYSQLFAVTDQINTGIIRNFRENNIEIPFPTRTMIMEKGSE